MFKFVFWFLLFFNGGFLTGGGNCPLAPPLATAMHSLTTHVLRSVIATENSCLPTRHLYFCCQMGWATSPSLASLQSRRISDNEHALNSRPPSWIGEPGMSTRERLREWDWGSHEPKWRLTQYRMSLSVAHQKRLLCRNTEEIRIWRHFHVSVRHHGRENSVKVEVNFTSSGSSIFLVLNLCCGKCI